MLPENKHVAQNHDEVQHQDSLNGDRKLDVVHHPADGAWQGTQEVPGIVQLLDRAVPQ